MEFKKAVKIKQRLRLAIDGVSGSGKTYTALSIATGIAKTTNGRIALIDSEHGSASLYADRFDFDTLELQQFEIENYIEALETAATSGYLIVIVDSTSHAWDALVTRVERIGHLNYGGNTFRAWAEGTPLQNKLIEALLNYPGHVIATCRAKSEFSIDKNEKTGKTVITKVGTAAVQRQGFEYEFTMTMRLDDKHIASFTKDRTGKFQGKFIEKPGEEMGKQLIEWLNEGAVNVGMIEESWKELKNIMLSTADEKKLFTDEEYQAVVTALGAYKGKPDEEKLEAITKMLNEKKAELQDRYSKLQEEKAVVPTGTLIFDGDGMFDEDRDLIREPALVNDEVDIF